MMSTGAITLKDKPGRGTGAKVAPQGTEKYAGANGPRGNGLGC